MWATIIIAESFTRIMGSAAGNVYSTIVAVVSCSIIALAFMDPGWGGQNFLRGGPGPLPPSPPRWRQRCQCRYLGIFFVSGRIFKRSFDHSKCQFFKALNAIFSKVGRFASEAVFLNLIGYVLSAANTSIWC